PSARHIVCFRRQVLYTRSASAQRKFSVKVVAIYPAFAPEINEMAVTWQHLTAAGLVECRVVAGENDILRATRSGAGLQRLPNLEIFRVPGLLAPGQVDDAAVAWAADLVRIPGTKKRGACSRHGGACWLSVPMEGRRAPG